MLKYEVPDNVFKLDTVFDIKLDWTKLWLNIIQHCRFRNSFQDQLTKEEKNHSIFTLLQFLWLLKTKLRNGMMHMSNLANELKSKYHCNSVILNIILASCVWVSFTWTWDEIEHNYLLIAFHRTDFKKRYAAPGKVNRHENTGLYSSWTFHSTIIYLWTSLHMN